LSSCQRYQKQYWLQHPKDSKIFGSDSDWDNNDADDDNEYVNTNGMVKKVRIKAWNYSKLYAKNVETLDSLDVLVNQLRMNGKRKLE
jgi:hypothetical protein